MYVRYTKILTWLQGFLVIFLYLVRFYLCSSLARQWRSEKFGILSLKPRSHVRILIYRTWAIFFVFSFKIINAFCVFIFIQMNFPGINHSFRCSPTPSEANEVYKQANDVLLCMKMILLEKIVVFLMSCSTMPFSLQSLSRWNIHVQASWPKQSCQYDGRFSWSNNARDRNIYRLSSVDRVQMFR